MIAKLVLLGTLLPAVVWATSQQWNIFTEWNGAPVLHVPVTITLNADDLPDTLKLTVDAPFFNDPAPAADDNANYIGLWDYEVVEVFFLNAANQYLQVEITPRGQYFVLLFDGVRNYKRFSLPLTTTASITGDSWSATAHIPLAYLPQGVNKFNAYATHGTPPNRHYEALSPAPSDALSPDYHALQFFHDLDLDVTIPGYSALPASQVWTNALEGKISYEIQTYWNSTAIEHEPVILTLDGNKEELFLHIDAPFFDDPPPPGQAGEPFFPLYDYEVVEAFFLNNENQYLEVEVGPYGQHLDLLLWTKNGEYNQLRHSLPMVVTTTIKRKRNRWTGTATIPVEYFPPKVSKFNAYSMHIPGPGRHQESLYPQDPTDEIADFHALKYFQPIDLNSVVPGQSERPMSQLWVDTIQGIFRYEVKHEWNSVPIDHDPATITLEGFEAGVELNVTAPFFNDPPPPGGEPGKPYFGLWDYEVVEMFFLNDNEEYLEVEVGPYGEHLLLLLKNQSNAIMHSIPLDYVVTARVNGTNGEPGMWQGSALIPPEYFPPNVTRMNAYAIHGTDDTRVYEALYPAPLDDPNYPAPNFHALDLFQKIDFEFLVVDNSQYSQFWLDAIANSTAPPKAAAPIEQSDESDSNGAFASKRNRKKIFDIRKKTSLSVLDRLEAVDLKPLQDNSLSAAMASFTEVFTNGVRNKFVKRDVKQPNRLTFRIGTLWNGTEVDHDPIEVSLERRDEGLLWRVKSPLFEDAAPDSPPGGPLWGLWNYEVVEIFLLNDENKYLELEVCPHGQHLALLLHNKRNILRQSLPLQVLTEITNNSWTAEVIIPASHLPHKVNKINAYAMHLSGGNRQAESLFPQPATDKQAEFHSLENFGEFDIDALIPGFSSKPESDLWKTSAREFHTLSVNHRGDTVEHIPISVRIKGNDTSLTLEISSPVFKDKTLLGIPGHPTFDLWKYEVVQLYFLNNHDQFTEVMFGPHCHYQIMLQEQTNTLLRHSLPLTLTCQVIEDHWVTRARIPLDYLPPDVTRFHIQASHTHTIGAEQSFENLYPANHQLLRPTEFNFKQYRLIDMDALVPKYNYLPTSDMWMNAKHGLFEYYIKWSWHEEILKNNPPTKFSLEKMDDGILLHVDAAIYPKYSRKKQGQPMPDIKQMDVFIIVFANEKGQYLEVCMTPNGNSSVIGYAADGSIFKDEGLELVNYMVNIKKQQTEEGGNPAEFALTGMIKSAHFPPSVNLMNAYYIHGEGRHRVTEALYPAPVTMIHQETVDLYAPEMFWPLDFDRLKKGNEEPSPIWMQEGNNVQGGGKANNGSIGKVVINKEPNATSGAADDTPMGWGRTLAPIVILSMVAAVAVASLMQLK